MSGGRLLVRNEIGIAQYLVFEGHALGIALLEPFFHGLFVCEDLEVTDIARNSPRPFARRSGHDSRCPNIVAGHYDLDKANWVLANGYADLVAFGRPFIANPDLPYRLAQGLPLDAFDGASLFGGGELRRHLASAPAAPQLRGERRRGGDRQNGSRLVSAMSRKK